MDEKRFVLSDRTWERLAPLLPGKATDSGRTGSDNRLFLEAVVWRLSGGFAPVLHGGIYRRILAIGTASSAGSDDGPSVVFLRVFSTL